MSESPDADKGPKLKVAVVDESHANEVPENIDADLYETTRPESSLKTVSADPDSDLAEALRRHGFEA